MTALTLAQALKNAIHAEQAAARFYDLLAQSTDDPEARRFLAEMAGQELAHARELAELASRTETGELPARPDERFELAETSPDWKYVDDLGYGAALRLALELEQHAAVFYDALAGSTDGPVRELFERLARVEETHAGAVERLLGD